LIIGECVISNTRSLIAVNWTSCGKSSNLGATLVNRLLAHVHCQFIAHHLSNLFLIFTETILESVQKVEKEFSDVSLFKNWNGLTTVVDDVLKYIRRVLVLDIAEEHTSKHELHFFYEVPASNHFYFFDIVHVRILAYLLEMCFKLSGRKTQYFLCKVGQEKKNLHQ